MRWLLFLLFYAGIGTFDLNAQSKVEISGTVTDTLGIPLAFATIMILDAADSSYINFTQTDKSGNFNFKQNIEIPVIIKVNYLGYFPFEKELDPKNSNVFNLGSIRLVQINNVLFEVVIREAKAPLKMRGDTIEYDATTFKVPSGSTVEDLLRKLPGIDVAGDGTISSHGQNVNKVTVDGKRFFGDDPTMATKNLPAESVSKVQVFNEKSEQEKLTGLPLDKSQKTMNLELKEDFKKGGFGKLVAGIGVEEQETSIATTELKSKWELKGNYNKFNKKEQLSLLGIRNNTGRNGMNWNDYQDFKGQQSWEWNQAEEIFGFGSGQYFRYYGLGSEEEGDEFGSFEGYFGDDAAGLPNNSQAGINYNYEHNKLKWTSNYVYKQNNLLSEAIRKRQFFLPDNNYTTDDQSTQERRNGSHRAELIFEKEFDSLNTLVLKLRGNATFTQTIVSGLFNNLNSEDFLISKLDLNKNADRKNLGWQGVAYYKHKFKNKKRNFGINFIYNDNDRTTDENQYSKNEFYDLNLMDSISILDQFIQLTTDIRSIRSSALYVEPVGKDFSLQFFGNYIQRNDELNRNVFDKIQDDLILNYIYSRYNDHVFRTYKTGSILQYGKGGFNLSGGLAFQNIQLEGSFQEGNSQIKTIDRSYNNMTGSITANYQLSANRRIGFNYYGNVQEPNFRNLSPIIDNSNPLFIRVGNPDLDPERSHQFYGNYYGNNQATFTNYNFNLNYTYYDNQHISDQTVDSFLVTTSKMVNYKGGIRLSSYMGYGFPIIKNKLTIRSNYSYSYGLSKSIINAVLNDAVSNNHGLGISLSWTPNDQYSIYSDNRLNYSTTSYSIGSQQNYDVWSQVYNVQCNAKLVWKVFLNATLDYKIFTNQRFGAEYEVPILNASIYRLFLKGDRMEIRLSTYDLFNRNISIRQSASVNQISDTRTFLLSRYYLLSVSYNMRGIRASVKKSNDWMF